MGDNIDYNYLDFNTSNVNNQLGEEKNLFSYGTYFNTSNVNNQLVNGQENQCLLIIFQYIKC